MIAQLQYTYGGHTVGKVNVVPSKAVVEDNYLEDIEKGKPLDEMRERPGVNYC